MPDDCIIIPIVKRKEAMYCVECDSIYNFSDSRTGCPRCGNRCTHPMVWGKQISNNRKEEDYLRVNGKGEKYSLYHYAR